MTDGVFIVRNDNTLVEMRSSPFESEELLQQLLATHPSLIAGDAVDPTNPCRWLLITREQAVPDEEGRAGRSITSSSIRTACRRWSRSSGRATQGAL